ncbi:MAG: hypothetical protein V2B20_27285 [Pseudomonadota bacterium]
MNPGAVVDSLLDPLDADPCAVVAGLPSPVFPGHPRDGFSPNACYSSSSSSFFEHDHGAVVQHSIDVHANDLPYSHSSSLLAPYDKKKVYFYSVANLSCSRGIDTTHPPTAATTSHRRKRSLHLRLEQHKHQSQEEGPTAAGLENGCAAAGEFGCAVREHLYLL